MKSLYPWQSEDWQRLQKLRERLPNGILLSGMAGLGKFDLALNFAQSLLCETPENSGEACGQCPACHWFAQGSHPDFRLLQPDSLSQEAAEDEKGKKPSKQISVEQVRGLADFVGMTSHRGGHRVVLVYPAESMNINAANALLKSLEEPPAGLVFILVSHQPQQLLPTIRSRCLKFPLATPGTADVLVWLKQGGVANPEVALAAAGYSPLRAMAEDDEAENVMREKLLRAVRQPAAMDVFALADTLGKTEQVRVVHWLQQWTYDLLSTRLTGQPRYHLAEAATLRQLVAERDPLSLVQLQKLLQTAKREAMHTLNSKLFFESLLISYRQCLLD
jgi:DNA polymerase-3 subunit delta'